MKIRKGGKKNRKLGRGMASCALYRASGKQEKNRIRRIKRHVKHHPGDQQAAALLE